METTTEWAREHGVHYFGSITLDNYEPSRNVMWYNCYRYSTEHVKDAFIIDCGMLLKDATRSVFLMDDGNSVRPCYVAAWHPEQMHLIVHPFPTGKKHTTWALGPRRAYHVKLRP